MDGLIRVEADQGHFLAPARTPAHRYGRNRTCLRINGLALW
ncbi:MAG: hypothetical protein Q27BPR15_15190 [Rhodobacter sp. CACIA14H1]|nr:MAG: hypothetical protein Q27BPR15_15190 [Rhodobacter sp. CACIA14H1]